MTAGMLLMDEKVIKICWCVPAREGDLHLPAYETAGAAGMDVEAAVAEDLAIAPGERVLVPTGFCVSLPPGYEIQVRPRSGLAIKHGLTIINSPGTIDADYRGEIKIAMVNLGHTPYTISRGDRIAQLVLAPVARARLQVVSALDTTERAAGGFGHTGK